MPKGVEHSVDATLSRTHALAAKRSVMPKGVEHFGHVDIYGRRLVKAKRSVMPKGVEHLSAIVRTAYDDGTTRKDQ